MSVWLLEEDNVNFLGFFNYFFNRDLSRRQGNAIYLGTIRSFFMIVPHFCTLQFYKKGYER